MGPTRDFWTVACSLPCRCNQLFSLEPHASRPFRETPQQHSSVRGKPAIVTETNKEKQQPNRENTNRGQPRTFSDWNSQIGIPRLFAFASRLCPFQNFHAFFFARSQRLPLVFLQPEACTATAVWSQRLPWHTAVRSTGGCRCARPMPRHRFWDGKHSEDARKK